MFRLDPYEHFLKPMPCPHKKCDVHVLNKEDLIIHLATHNKPKTLHWWPNKYHKEEECIWSKEDPGLAADIKNNGGTQDATHTYKLSQKGDVVIRRRR